MTRPVSIVIPTWNGREILERNLPSVQAALEAYPAGGETIVVDDGSRDGSVEWLRLTHPPARVVARASNEGFGAAVNAGVAAARFERVVLLNNDMRVEPDFLAPLLAPFETVTDLFAATPRIVNRTWGGDEAVTACAFRFGLIETVFPERAGSGSPRTAAAAPPGRNAEHAGARVDDQGNGSAGLAGHDREAPAAVAIDPNAKQGATPKESTEKRSPARAGQDLPAFSRTSLPGGDLLESPTSSALQALREVLFACGGAAAFDRARWLALGGLDSLYAPFYWEDVDLSWRARKRGWRIAHVPGSVVHHEHSATIGARFDAGSIAAINERNRLLFQWKNLSSGRLTGRHLAWLPVRIVRALAGRPEFLRGLAMAAGRLGRALEARRIERSAARRSDDEILAEFLVGSPQR